MATFAQRYCAHHHCGAPEFQRRIFWRTLHWHAVPLAPLLLLSAYFDSDLDLIDACSRATRMKQIHEEIRDHPVHPHHGSWLHRQARIRVSSRRLRRLAARYLTTAASPEGRAAPYYAVTTAKTG